jgi:hypothetical protein
MQKFEHFPWPVLGETKEPPVWTGSDRIMRSGGLAHIEVPADPACFDLYDEVLLHFRRYRLSDLVAKASRTGFIVRKVTHLGFFVYPIFKYAKKRNQRLRSNLTQEQKRRVVEHQIRKTNQRRILASIFHLERFLGSVITYPIGIRAVVRLEKP